MFGEIAPQSPTFNSLILLPNKHTAPRPAHQALVRALKATTSVYLHYEDAEKSSSSDPQSDVELCNDRIRERIEIKSVARASRNRNDNNEK